MAKTLTITHDGSFIVSGFGTLVLGTTPLSNVIAGALEIGGDDLKQYEADVSIVIRIKDNEPQVQLEGETC